jgi:uncharacterized protein
MRVILDTNILLSALLAPHGKPAQIIAAWKKKRFQIAFCAEILTELREVAQCPFFRARLRASLADSLAASLYDLGEFYEELPSTTGAPDAKDNFLLALATVSQADFLVTGDKGLLSLKHYKATRIITPVKFVEVYEP